MMHGGEKSDLAVVAGKPAKAAVAAAAEPVEPRAGAKGNAGQTDTRRARVSPGLERVRTAARLNQQERLTALLHHVDVALLRFAYQALRRDAAAGVDADIAGFFDTVRHDWLIRFVERRVGDRRIRRLIRKWPKAGVMEDGVVQAGEAGTPQGAVIAPLLANIYLYNVFDLWAHRWRGREAQGAVILVRYADDIVAGFEHRADAERFVAGLRGRMGAFGLTLHADKTRLVEFGRNAAAARRRRGLGKPETFDFLGFTHICGVSRKGKFSLHRKTRADRLRAKLREVQQTLRRRLHEPIAEPGAWLRQVVRGFFAYHAVPNNIQALGAFRRHLGWLWGRALRRRSQNDRTPWGALTRLSDHWPPKPHIIHPWPDRRFAANHPRWEPGAGTPHAGFCARGAP